MKARIFTWYYFLVSVALLCCLIACEKNKRIAEIDKMTKEWIGKKISFPEKLSCLSVNVDTMCISPHSTPYKILVYTDSTGCLDCKSELYLWDNLIEEVKNEMPDKVNFQFYFQQPQDLNELKFFLRRKAFKHPCYIDSHSQLDGLNNLPKDSRFQTFLLDKDDKVVLIGTPIYQSKVWELYKKVIRGEKDFDSPESKDHITSIEIEEETIELRGLRVNEPHTATFILKNVGNKPLILNNILASCDCTIPQWNKAPIFPGDTTKIDVEITPDREGYFRKTITVNCNIEQSTIHLAVKGFVQH